MNDPGIGDDEFVRLYADRERAAGQDTQAETASTDTDCDAAKLFPDTQSARQELDVALASLLLQEEIVNEQQLAQAISDWTIHGTESLGEHLVRAELISRPVCERLQRKSQRRLNQIAKELEATLVTDSSVTDETILSLEQIDSSGRVATLLGMSSNPAAAGQSQKRRFSEDYTLIRKLGQGGLGTVWLARDNSLRRYVALKEVNEALQSNPTTVSRFSHEAVVTGRLEHPSIVPIHQFARDVDTGQTFYTMRFLGKQTMQDAITEYHERREDGDHDPMLLHHLLSAFISVCQAIAYAHSRNVVHRDLKPENIALDGYGQVIVLDWGLAKTLGESDLQDEIIGDLSMDQSQTHKTVAGQVMGTPMYMAPEQAAGRIDEIDERTDVYGLGAILFEILTGDPPHARSHRSITSGSRVAELLTAIMNNPIPGARELNSEVSLELNAVCAKALARKRYARYSSASDLAEDVQRWTVGEPVSAWREPWSKRAQRWVGQHRLISQAAAALTTVLLVASVTVGIVMHQNRLAEQDARVDAIRAEGRELEIRLKSRSLTLGKNVRFMATLPPIQGIIDARGAQQTTDEESVWRERLETIFRGLLIANPDYLAISYASVSDSTQQIVRVERTSADGSFVRALPASRLGEDEKRSELQEVLNLKPGDVYMADSRSVATDGVAADEVGFTLLAATPIYDEMTGDAFGVVSVESNIEQVLEYLLESTANAASNVYVTDNSGVILMHHSRDRGLQTTLAGRQVGSLIPDLSEFFGPEQLADTMTDDAHFHAVRVRIDSRRAATVVGLVLTFAD